MRVCIALLLLACAAVAWCAEELPPLPNVICPRIDRDIKLTGKLDDPLWGQAPEMTFVGANDGKPMRFKTTARMLFNARYLYVAFACQDDYIWGTCTKRDDPIYNEEVVEIFLSPTGFVRNYYEIEVSPLNTVADTYVLNGRPQDSMIGKGFYTYFQHNLAGLQTMTSVVGELNKPGACKGWIVEMAIPFADLIGPDIPFPTPGTEWRLDLFRVDVPEKGKPEYYAWSPIMEPNDLHRPWRFGTVIFSPEK